MTIWKKGDSIPEASEEMEAYYAYEEERWRASREESLQGWNLPEDEEAVNKWETLYNAVPEWK